MTEREGEEIFSMKGFVETPESIADLMVKKLFHYKSPTDRSTILDPGCGTGVFIEGIIRWCQRKKKPLPRIIGIELNPEHVAVAKRKLKGYEEVTIHHGDFLQESRKKYDYIIANPPYVPITGLSDEERVRYRSQYKTAQQRFDLYLLFFEQALKCLKQGGRLVFITPEKYLYVDSAAPLRKIIGRLRVREIHFLDEETFGKLVTYPVISTIENKPGPFKTRIIPRKGKERRVVLTSDGSFWMPLINGRARRKHTYTLSDICLRISCGVATGSDSVYVVRNSDLPPDLGSFAYPSISGRQITYDDPRIESDHSMLVPYMRSGRLIDEDQLNGLLTYLGQPENYSKLMKRTCVEYKAWYAFHENPPLDAILRPKILCKDISAKPFFVLDQTGEYVPRHSVYYIVPKDPSRIHEILDYLNSQKSRSWLKSHCQRAANGFLRLQSRTLKQLPVPKRLVSE